MSGHSKWSNIKRRKGASDAARGKIFTKLGREIAVAVKAGGADPASNSRLRDIINKAKASNMPNDNITRSIKKASGELNTINYETVVYEGYGAGGVAVIVEALTDNRNRTAGDVRHIFDKSGGSMGTTGCVSFSFDYVGLIVAKRAGAECDEMAMNLALEANAQDFSAEGDVYEIIVSATDFASARDFLEKSELEIIQAELTRLPQNTVVLEEENLVKFLKMLERLEDNEDVNEVYHNAELPENEEAE